VTGATRPAAGGRRGAAGRRRRFGHGRTPAARPVLWLMLALLCPTPAAVQPPPPLFREVAEETALRFTHDNGAAGQFALPEIMGSGAALFDYDSDGDLDAFLVQSAPLDGTSRPHTGSRLFRNDLRVENGRAVPRFSDVTEAAGVGVKTFGMGAAVGDIDGDADLDLYVSGFGANTLLRNNGNGTFMDVTDAAGLADSRWSTSAAFLDYDRDGDLDLYVGNYVAFTMAGNKTCTDPAGARDYCAPAGWPAVPDRLLRNDGQGRFTDVSEPAGITRAYGPALGVAVGDFDADGWPDIYVANDAQANQLWRNRGDGTFEDVGLLSGTAVNAGGRPEGSMGIALGDPDNDGDEDIFVSNLVGETHVLYANDGSGNFEDARAGAELARPTAAMTGFGTGWFDYDHDGWLDLFIANGAVNIVEALRGQPNPFRQRNQLFHNDGSGRFRELTGLAGPAFESLEVSRAAAFGDIDNDGDVDILVTNNNGPARLLLNDRTAGAPARADDQQTTPLGEARRTASEPTRPPHWVAIALRAGTGNRFGIGARVGIVRDGERTVWRRARSDGSYLSASDHRVHVGLGMSARLDAVLVEWPDGLTERFSPLLADTFVTLSRGTGRPLAGSDR
jgi:enediyne biosynthesis protein E4